MKLNIFLIFFLFFMILTQTEAQTFTTKFEQSKGTETVTYEEGIAYFQKLADAFDMIELQEKGTTDCGKPLHLVILSLDKDFNPQSIAQKNKSVLMLNNAIHPGEPDGVDATMMLFRDIAQNKDLQKLLKNTVIVAIPFYNVGGVINRNSFSRANQNGPKAYGFRGNARNLDLNRDFIKADSKNVLSFIDIFQTWNPDVFIDNHVSNGADYQYVMTMLMTTPEKLGQDLGTFLKDEMYPDLEQKMIDKKFEMCPYVKVYGRSPDNGGYNQFYDTPRYTSGYTALFQTIGFIAETHMLKAYKPRVESTYSFMFSVLEYLAEHGQKLHQLRKTSLERIANQKSFILDWELDKSQYKELWFKGYEASEIPSKVTTGTRLFYDRNKPFTKKIPFYNTFVAKDSIEKPIAYIIPKAWHKVIKLLNTNEVEVKSLEKDIVLEVATYYIEGYETLNQPYENHYLHSSTKVRKEIQKIQFYVGDYVVYTNQSKNKFIIETLEPTAPDSFFNWNFFDTILQQKEGFSPYVFEDIAAKLLAEDVELREKFNFKKANDKEFAENPQAQLAFIYYNSPHYEQVHNRYPIFRLEKEVDLD